MKNQRPLHQEKHNLRVIAMHELNIHKVALQQRIYVREIAHSA